MKQEERETGKEMQISHLISSHVVSCHVVVFHVVSSHACGCTVDLKLRYLGPVVSGAVLGSDLILEGFNVEGGQIGAEGVGVCDCSASTSGKSIPISGI